MLTPVLDKDKDMPMNMRNPPRLLTPWARQVLTLGFVGLSCAVALSAYMQIL